VDSYDITAITIPLQDKILLAITCYDPRDKGSVYEQERQLSSRMALVQQTIQQVLDAYPAQAVEVCIGADLNRHHVLWGGPQTLRSWERHEEANPIIDLMQECRLHSLLKSGTITWEHQSQRMHSTPDIVLGSAGIQEAIVQCQIHSQDYGSDHRPITLTTSLLGEWHETGPSRRNYQQADWAAIRETLRMVLQQAYPHTDTGSSHDTLDRAAEHFIQIVNRTLETMVPRAKPSPMAKRWWTSELTALCRQLTQLRNAVSTQHRRGNDTEDGRRQVQQARKAYFAVMDKQKAQHWKDFLSDPENLWKANSYTKGGSAAMLVPPLQAEGRTMHDDSEKAALLMATFPQLPAPKPRQEQESRHAWRRQPLRALPRIAAHEARQAIFRANPRKAAGTDEITARVWQELWPVIQTQVLQLYQASLDLCHVP